MSRTFSIARRRNHLVHLTALVQANVDEYLLRWATNFDVANPWTEVLTCSSTGYLDPVINQNVLHVVPGPYVPIVFDPATFSIDDEKPFWLKVIPVTGGVEGTSTPPTMILPESLSMGLSGFVVSGNAPQGAAFVNAFRIDLPRGARQTVRFQNEADMYVAFDPSGPEMFLPGAPTPKYLDAWMPQGSIFVRGSGGIVPFSAMFTTNPVT